MNTDEREQLGLIKKALKDLATKLGEERRSRAAGFAGVKMLLELHRKQYAEVQAELKKLQEEREDEATKIKLAVHEDREKREVHELTQREKDRAARIEWAKTWSPIMLAVIAIVSTVVQAILK